MRQILLIISCLFFSHLFAQELVVKSLTKSETGRTASSSPRLDLNRIPGALVRVKLNDEKSEFRGNVLGEVEHEGDIYYVYMSDGSRQLQVLPSKHFPMMVTFADHGTRSVKGGETYDLVLADAEPEQQAGQGQLPNQKPLVADQPELTGDMETIKVGNVSFKMVRVKAGSFKMGNDSGEPFEAPAHTVTLTNDFYIGETEVTQELWEAVMGRNPSYFKNPKHPVADFRSAECRTFISKLNRMTGRKFRLPTEAEWEYAARGGHKSKGYKYSGSNNIDEVAVYGRVDLDSNSPKYGTQNVASMKPNELGIYDMSGNVQEWVISDMSNYKAEAVTNPVYSEKEPNMGRGGCWGHQPKFCTSAYRTTWNPMGWYDSMGIRLAH